MLYPYTMTVLIDAGHGGLDAFGHYRVRKWGKKFQHAKRGFHGGGFFYEGHFNRIMADLLAKELKKWGIPSIIISDPILDLSLSDRVAKANHYYKALKKKAFLISLHANASGSHKAQGYEVFTSPGQTHSDIFATYHYEHTRARLSDRIKFRSDNYSDGDPDKESRFTVLTQTHCPAILVEHLFFDNLADALMLMDKYIQKEFTKASAKACFEFIEYLKSK